MTFVCQKGDNEYVRIRSHSASLDQVNYSPFNLPKEAKNHLSLWTEVDRSSRMCNAHSISK